MTMEDPNLGSGYSGELQKAFREERETEFYYEPAFDEAIVLEALPFATDLYSPTPADPLIKTVDGQEYIDSAKEWMLDRLRARVTETRTNLEARYVRIIEKEIEAFHLNRVRRNIEAMARWRAVVSKNPKQLTEEDRAIIRRERAGQASDLDTLTALKRWPQIGALGQIQFTAPLNGVLIQKVASQNLENVKARLTEASIEFKELDQPPTYKSPRKHNTETQRRTMQSDSMSSDMSVRALRALTMDTDGRYPFVILQKPLLEITFDDTVVQLVEVRNPFAAPLLPKISGIYANKTVVPGIGMVNLQDISYATFYNVVSSPRLNEEPIEMFA